MLVKSASLGDGNEAKLAALFLRVADLYEGKRKLLIEFSFVGAPYKVSVNNSPASVRIS